MLGHLFSILRSPFEETIANHSSCGWFICFLKLQYENLFENASKYIKGICKLFGSEHYTILKLYCGICLTSFVLGLVLDCFVFSSAVLFMFLEKHNAKLQYKSRVFVLICFLLQQILHIRQNVWVVECISRL